MSQQTFEFYDIFVYCSVYLSFFLWIVRKKILIGTGTSWKWGWPQNLVRNRKQSKLISEKN